MSLTRKFAERLKQPSENMTIPDIGQETKIVRPHLQIFRFKKTILQGTMKGKIRIGRQRKNNIKEWTLLAQLRQLRIELDGKGLL